MKRWLFFPVTLLLVGLSSCNLLSLYPLYTSEVLVRNDRMSGDWRWTVDSSYLDWTFTPPKEDDYEYRLLVTHPEEGEEEEYRIHLVQLGDDFYFDIYPGENRGLLLTEWLACHTFGKVEFRGEAIIYYPFDYDWLKGLFDQRKIRLRHERVSDTRILLTASPEELQKFLLKYGKDENAYLDPIRLERPL